MATAAAELRAELARLRQEIQARAAKGKTQLALVDFAARYLSAEQPDGRLVPLAPGCDFHRWLAAELEALGRTRGRRLDVLAPRGSAKSTWTSVAFPLWCGVHGKEPYIVLASDTDDQAKDFLRKIRDQLEGNHALLRDFPAAAGVGPVWQAHYLRLRNGVGIRAISTGGKIRGRSEKEARPSLIIVDDPQNLEHIISPARRERSWDWLVRDVCSAGSPRTNIVVLGTALHREAIVCRLQITPGWQSRVFRSVEPWPERMDLWAEWELILHDHNDDQREAKARAYYEANRPAMDAGAQVLWPERESLYALMTRRASDGPAAFASEKQNDPVDPTLCEWPSSYFDWPGIWFDTWPHDLTVKTIGLDPSKGKDAKHGDYSAFVRYGYDARSHVEYVEADLARRNMEQIIEDAVGHCRAFRPEAIAVETHTFQELLVAPLLEAARRAGVPMTVQPVENMAPAKPVRIRRHGPYLAQRLVRFKARSPGTQLLVQQLRDFPNGDHDDGPDAWEMARRVAIDLFNGRQQRRPTQRVGVWG
jgi:predicted phage terminase large subunit-like protein